MEQIIKEFKTEEQMMQWIASTSFTFKMGGLYDEYGMPIGIAGFSCGSWVANYFLD